MPSRKGVDLLMVRNRVFRLRKFRYGQGNLKGPRFADAHEPHFQAWKRSLMCSAVLLGSRFADVQELLFLTAKRSDMGYAELQRVYLLIVRNGVFELLNVQI